MHHPRAVAIQQSREYEAGAMRAVVQRVQRASVTVEGQVVGAIGPGLCALVGVGARDDEAAALQLAAKVIALRVFEDSEGKMSRDLQAEGGALLAISQFTLFGDVRRGRRPSFTDAMEPTKAAKLFDAFVAHCRNLVPVETGRFGADMKVELLNDGPVTIWLDSADKPRPRK